MNFKYVQFVLDGDIKFQKFDNNSSQVFKKYQLNANSSVIQKVMPIFKKCMHIAKRVSDRLRANSKDRIVRVGVGCWVLQFALFNLLYFKVAE